MTSTVSRTCGHAVTSEANPTVLAAAHNPDVFYRLFGDATGGGRVNSLDYNLMLNDYGLRSGDPGFNACLDFNADGVIDDTDYNAFLNNDAEKVTSIVSGGCGPDSENRTGAI